MGNLIKDWHLMSMEEQVRVWEEWSDANRLGYWGWPCTMPKKSEEAAPIMAMGFTCSKGQKGRLKSSRREFEIIDTTSSTSTIRFKGERDHIEVPDEVLRAEAEDIDGFSY